MNCPLCDSEAIVIKKQILEYSVINFMQCSDKKCAHKFVTNVPTKPYPDKNIYAGRNNQNNQVNKSSDFHFLDNRN